MASKYCNRSEWGPDLFKEFQDLPEADQAAVLDEMQQDTKVEFQKTLVSYISGEVSLMVSDPTYLTERQAKEASRESSLELIRTPKKAVSNDIANYCVIIENDNYFRGRIRYNALNNRVTVIKFYWNAEIHPIRDIDVFNIRKLISEIYGISNINNIRQAIEIAAHNRSFHPIRTELKSYKWDGIQRIPYLFPRYLGAEESEYTTEATLVMLHGHIQRVFNPGIKYDTCPVLQDKAQGTGKSTMARFLAIRDEWFTDSLGSLDNAREAYEAICGKWIIELSEMLATKRTKDIENIKAFISRTEDNYRTPYETYTEQRPRQCAFIGTSNRPDFLPDDMTGNRRFIPILCNKSRAERHPLDDENETRNFIKQCYAEAMFIGEQEGWHLTMDKRFNDELEAIRNASTPEDPRVGMIQAWLDETDEDLVCSKMIYDEVISTGSDKPSKYELNTISEIMNLSISGWDRFRGVHGTSKDNKYRFPSPYGMQRAWQRSVPRAEKFKQIGLDFVPSDLGTDDAEGFKSMAAGEKTPF